MIAVRSPSALRETKIDNSELDYKKEVNLSSIGTEMDINSNRDVSVL